MEFPTAQEIPDLFSIFCEPVYQDPSIGDESNGQRDRAICRFLLFALLCNSCHWKEVVKLWRGIDDE